MKNRFVFKLTEFLSDSSESRVVLLKSIISSTYNFVTSSLNNVMHIFVKGLIHF